MNWLVVSGNNLKPELKQGTTARSAWPIEPTIPDGIYLSIANSPLETVAMPHSAEALKDQADDLTLASHSFSQSRFFFISPSHLDAYLQLLDSLKQQRKLTLLIGEPGIGKTTLLNKLISETPPRIKLILCNPTASDFDSLLALINERLGLSVSENTRAHRLSALQNYLNAPAIRFESLVLMIEDAQHLSETAFEELFKLILLEQDARCPLRVILSGSPRLAQCLNGRKILHVLPADTLFLHLSPLDGPATASYIYRQLGDAGNPAPGALFPAPVIARIAHYAHGLPQLINRLCQHTLESARETGQISLSVELVDRAANELEIGSRPAASTERKRSSLYFAVPVVLASLIAALIGLPHLLSRLPLVSKPDIATSATVPSPTVDPSAGQQREPPSGTSPKATVPQAMATVPAVPSAAPSVEPAAPAIKPTSTPPAPDNGSPAQPPGSATDAHPVATVTAVPVAEPPVAQVEPPASRIEAPTSSIKPTATPGPNSTSAIQAPTPKPIVSRPDRVSSRKPAMRQRTRSLPLPQPVIPPVQVHKTPPPPRPKADPSNTRYKSAAYHKHTARSAPRSESDAQDSNESNGWRIRK